MSPYFALETVLHEGREYRPGQEIPIDEDRAKDAVDREVIEQASSPSIDAEAFEDATDSPENANEGDTVDYSKLDKPTLEAIVAGRGLEIHGSGRGDSVTKGDLVGALEANDQSTDQP